MSQSKNDIHWKKRGRKSGEELTQRVALALKHVQELEYLDESTLASLPAVQRLAKEQYRDGVVPTGFALRVLLMESANIVIRDLKKLPGYQREIKFLKAYLDCQSVAEISRSLGLCREHVARSIQPRAINMVARVFLARASDGRSDGIPEETIPGQRGR